VRQLATLTLFALLGFGCAAPGVDVTVSEPKVYGDDQVLRALATQRGRLLSLAAGIRPGDYQESFGVRRESQGATALGINLADPQTGPLPVPPSALPTRPQRWWDPGRFYPQPLAPGLSFRDQLRQRVDGARLLSSYELLLAGDTTLLDRRSRATLMRFEVAVNSYADLGNRRRFAVVEFVVKGKAKTTPAFGVYLLSPGYAAFVSRERALNAALDSFAGRILGSWGGVGAGSSYGSRSLEREEFEALQETPLQFAIYDARPVAGGGKRFAFALGPRRRLHERGALNPARWFGSNYEIVYELQPGPRTCEALLVFRDVDERASVEVEVSVFCDGRLVAEEDVDLTRALRRGQRPLETFEVRCPAPATIASTRRVTLDPRTGADLLLASDSIGPSFSLLSQVFVGPVAIPARAIRLLGRGRLAVRVSPSQALAALLERGVKTAVGRVVTPDQPDLCFVADLVSAKPRRRK